MKVSSGCGDVCVWREVISARLSPLFRDFAAVLSPRAATSAHTAQPQQHEQMQEWQRRQAQQPQHAAPHDAHSLACAWS